MGLGYRNLLDTTTFTALSVTIADTILQCGKVEMASLTNIYYIANGFNTNDATYKHYMMHASVSGGIMTIKSMDLSTLSQNKFIKVVDAMFTSQTKFIYGGSTRANFNKQFPFTMGFMHEVSSTSCFSSPSTFSTLTSGALNTNQFSLEGSPPTVPNVIWSSPEF